MDRIIKYKKNINNNLIKYKNNIVKIFKNINKLL